MAKRITFDTKIIETLYTSLRQITNERLTEFGERHTRARMDDVNYLVEDNARDDLLARALKNLSISIFIKVLPTSASRILATHLTTLTNSDGQCRCIERQPFIKFHLSEAKGTKSG